MQAADLVIEARKLSPSERFDVVEKILSTLDQPDESIDRLWQEEAQRRLAAYRAGHVKGIAAEDVLGPL